jgi:cellulose synthase/poly-beta-1,6-N-acetylglucosamine synthase-like glycosyltransferase
MYSLSNQHRLYRYTRFIVNTISSYCSTSIPPPLEPTLVPNNITVIIPTICGKDNARLEDTIRSCLHTGQHQVIIVTVDSDKDIVGGLAKSIDPTVMVLSLPYPNKRHQVSQGIRNVRTSITVIADDDVIWPPHLLPHILAPFEDRSFGAVGTCQQVRRNEDLSLLDRVWEFLGASYIQRRNFEITATSNIDGGISCLSGRTAAFRTEILQENSFIEGYCDEQWCGKPLNPDDDNFITRHLVAQGWMIKIQSSPEAVVQTTLETNRRYLHQCLRWARSNWRSNITSTIYERHVWR